MAHYDEISSLEIMVNQNKGVHGWLGFVPPLKCFIYGVRFEKNMKNFVKLGASESMAVAEQELRQLFSDICSGRIDS